jgi:hypothetical protein
MSKPMLNVNTHPAEPCEGGIFMRFNVGNLHAIKDIRSVPQPD